MQNALIGRGRGSSNRPSPTKSWELRLYVAGQTPKSVAALANLKRVCEEHLPGRHTIEVIDLLEHPARARGDQIVAIPTLVRKLPEPVRKIIGDPRGHRAGARRAPDRPATELPPRVADVAGPSDEPGRTRTAAGGPGTARASRT